MQCEIKGFEFVSCLPLVKQQSICLGENYHEEEE